MKNLRPFPKSLVKHLVYHGTDATFDEFKYTKHKRFSTFDNYWEVEVHGFFFTDSVDTARRYGKNVAAAYIDLRNPLVMPEECVFEDPERLEDAKWIFAPLIKKRFSLGGQQGEGIDIGFFALDIRNESWPDELIRNCNGIEWNLLDDPRIGKRMLERGYDGTLVNEQHDEEGFSYFVIQPKQIRWKWLAD